MFSAFINELKTMSESNSSLFVPKTTLTNSSRSSQNRSSGSATGNPRNKCALKPGHSLMDWVRLGSTGVDLSGTKGVVIPVSSLELAKHCTPTDAWMAIRGKVYNVSKYIDFHPGGFDELMKGVGKDATQMFDEVHAWVNYEQLLSKCFIGPLRNVVTIDMGPPKSRSTLLNSNNEIKSPEICSSITCQTFEITPRFDWIQKTSNLTIYIYTEAFCNPGIILRCNTQKNISLRILLEHNIIYLWEIQLLHEIVWPVNVEVSDESGKIELTLTKTEPKLWSLFGNIEKKKFTNTENLHFECEIKENLPINYNSFALTLKPLKNILIICPVGYHFNITDVIDGQLITKSYTPISSRYGNFENSSNETHNFLIKSYHHGGFAKHITSKSVDCTLRISQPIGNFNLKCMAEHNRIAFIAAGSGITPMLKLLDHLLKRKIRKVETIYFVLCNKKIQDIWCSEILNEIARNDERLSIEHILSDPDDGWSNSTGYISNKQISKLLNSNISFCCICGPTGFNDLTQKLLKDNSFNMKNIHFFKG